MDLGHFFYALQESLEGKNDNVVVLRHNGFSRQMIWQEIAKIIGWTADEMDFAEKAEFPYVGHETDYRRTGYMSSVSHYNVVVSELRAQCTRVLGPMPLPVYSGPILSGTVGPVRCYTLAQPGISLFRGEISVGDEGRGRYRESVTVLGKEAGYLWYATVTTVELREERRFAPLAEIAEESSDERYVLMLLNATGGHRGWVSYDLPEGSVILATGYVAQGMAGRMGGWDELLVLVPTGSEIRYQTGGGGGHVGGSHWLLIGRDDVHREDENSRIQRLALEKVAARKAVTTAAKSSSPTFNFLTLSGDRVEVGIRLSDNTYGSQPGRLTRFNGTTDALLAVVAGPATETLERVMVDRDGETVILVPSAAAPDTDQELVLVHEYSPGSGSKRWPSFYIDWTTCPVEKLGSVSRYRGSGSDDWNLVLAPVGWAANIAKQFNNWRDAPDQVISYKPSVGK